MRKLLFAIIAIIGCFLAFYVFAATYLNYCDKPEKSDVVVLFIGPDYKERLKEAHQLIEEGYAKTLIIPAHSRVFTVVDGTIKKIRNHQKIPFDRKTYPHYYENTHIEALEAKKMMNMAGYTSAIFISSPYHMRRISIISARIFSNEDYQLRFIGSRYIQQDSFLSFFSWSNIKQVSIEYFKIIGFFIYQFYEVVVSKKFNNFDLGSFAGEFGKNDCSD